MNMESKQRHQRVSASARRHERAEDSSHGGPQLPQMWPDLPWMNPWMEFWRSMWAGWLGHGLYHSSEAERAVGGERRHDDGLPWMPKVETTVIPLRRRTDPPGQHADRISMRVQIPNLPWLGGENVIAFDAVVPRSHETEQQADAGGGKVGSPKSR
jgi:hypothetical protein